MPGPPAAFDRESCYSGNLQALREVHPALTQAVEAVAIPEGWEAVVGRDGTPTYRVRCDEGRERWLGRSSMPVVSASAAVQAVASTAGNILIPGAGNGHAIIVLARELAPHRAVIVHEPDLVELKLTLHICNLSPLLRSSRLFMMSEPALSEALRELYRERPGLELPQAVLPVASASRADVERVRSEVQMLAPELLRLSAEAVAAAGAALNSVRPAYRSLVVLSPDCSPETASLAEGLRDAAADLGWSAAVCVANRPDRCGSLARLEAARAQRASAVFMLNGTDPAVLANLPASTAVAHWLVASASVGPALQQTSSVNARWYVCDAATRDRYSAAPNAPRLSLLERGVNPSVYYPQEVEAEQAQRLGGDIAIVADGADLTPEAVGLTLATHARLWTAACRRVADVVGRWRPAQAEQVLERAERDLKLRIDDGELRERFVSLVRTRAAPSLAARRAVKLMTDQGLAPGLWGSGWGSHGLGNVLRGDLADPADRNGLYNAAAMVIFPFYGEEAVQGAIDCLAAGGCPVLAVSSRGLHKDHPQLQPILRDVPQVTALEDLPKTVRPLLADSQARRRATESARSELLQQHTLAKRLEVLLPRADDP